MTSTRVISDVVTRSSGATSKRTTLIRPNGLFNNIAIPFISPHSPSFHTHIHTPSHHYYVTHTKSLPHSLHSSSRTTATTSTPPNSSSSIRYFSVKRNNHNSHTLQYTPKPTGKAGSKQYRVYYYNTPDEAKADDSSAISPWHHIPYKSDDTHNGLPLYRYINEIPKNTVEKYEISTSEVANPIKQDVKNDELRIFKYGKLPFNYGAIPQTWEDPDHVNRETTGLPGDNDPLDVVEISDKPLQHGYVYDIKPIGILALIDQNETDWKIIGVARGSKLFNKVNDLTSLNQHVPQFIEKLKDWFINYKTAEGKEQNTLGFDGEIKDSKYAIDIIEECHQHWNELTQRLDQNKLWIPNLTDREQS